MVRQLPVKQPYVGSIPTLPAPVFNGGTEKNHSYL